MSSYGAMTPDEKYTKYSNISKPPVIEAVIDITTPVISLNELNDIAIDGVDGVFPTKENIQNFEFEFRTDGGPSNVSGSFMGYMHRSLDGREVVQSRVNGFAYNVLQPYPNWDEFLDRAMKFWKAYVSARGNAKVSKLGLRYINSISVPTSLLSPTEAFDICVDIPKHDRLGGVHRFQYAYTISDHASNAMVTVNFLQQPSQAHLSNFVLDIDVTLPMSPLDMDDNEMRIRLSNLRELKNVVFFGTLSSRMLELYR